MAAALSAAAQSDTLTAGVFHPQPIVLKGATHDLADLDIRLIILPAGQSFNWPVHDSSDHLIIIKDGQIDITIDTFTRTSESGGIALVPASIPYRHLSAKTKSSFYLFSFRSRSGAYPARDRHVNLFVANWEDLIMKKTDKGESRAIFSQPSAWLKNINMHATTLNPGEISHPQHVHRAEEIILLRSGQVRMHIGDRYLPAKGGDLVFLPSGVPHDLENEKTGRCEYFALQWEP